MNTTFDKKSSSIVKGVAIIMMLIHHCFLNADRYKGYTINFYPFTEQQVNMAATYFKTCVGMFVFISGYGLSLSYKKYIEKNSICTGTITSFCLSRYIKLLGGYWFIFLLVHFIPYDLASQRMDKIYGTGIARYLYLLLDFLGMTDLYNSPVFDGTWWYMSLGILIVFSIPLLMALYKKCGIILLPLLLFIPRGLNLDLDIITRWFPAVTLGIICADTNLLVHMKARTYVNSRFLTKLIKLAVTGTLIILCMYYRTEETVSNYRDLWDGMAPFILIYFCFEFLNDIPILNTGLAYLGKHSMNIFLLHTFLREYYYKDFFYSFSSVFLVVAVLLGCSLLLSILIEAAKKLVRYDKLIDLLCLKIESIKFP